MRGSQTGVTDVSPVIVEREKRTLLSATIKMPAVLQHRISDRSARSGPRCLERVRS